MGDWLYKVNNEGQLRWLGPEKGVIGNNQFLCVFQKTMQEDLDVIFDNACRNYELFDMATYVINSQKVSRLTFIPSPHNTELLHIVLNASLLSAPIRAPIL